MKKAILAASMILVVCLASSQVPRFRVATPEIRLQAADPAAPALELLGKWPYGPCEACAIDAGRKFALIGNGETLQVLDISIASRPVKISEVTLEGSPQDIEISGNFAYVMTLNYLLVVSLVDLAHLSVLNGFVYSGVQLRSLFVSADRAYVAANFGVDIFDVSDPYHPAYRGTYRRGSAEFFDVAVWGTYAICAYTDWRWPDPATRTYGLEVIDVSVASAPRLVGNLDLGKDLLPREIAVTANGYALVCQSTDTWKSGALAVIDVGSDPGHPSETGRLVRTDGGFDGIALSGNLACVYQMSIGRMSMIDVSNPGSPVVLGAYTTGSIYQYRDMHQSAGLVGISNAGGGFSLYSVAAPSAPAPLGSFDTPDEVGWGNNIAVSGDRVYMACYSDGLRIMDVSDPSRPAEESMCNDRGLDRGVAVVGNIAYGVDTTRLSVFDISDSKSPGRLADLDLPRIDPTLESYGHSGIVVRPPYAYVSGVEWSGDNRRATLTIIDVSDPGHPSVVKTFAYPIKISNFGNLALYGNYAYLGVEDSSMGDADRRCGLRTIDVSDPRNPREVSSWRSDVAGSSSSRVAVHGDRLYLTGDQLRIFDLADPGAPRLVAIIVLGCADIAFSGDFAYLALDRLLVLDLSNLAGGTVPAYYYRGEKGKGIAVSGNIAYVPGSLSVYKNNVAPAISIVSPAARTTILGSIPIEVQASHDSGIRKVEFHIDGSLKFVDTSAPYTYLWDTAPYQDGVHTVRIYATNNEGRSSELLTDVFIRHVYAPLDFTGKTTLNRSLSQVEYINVLSWRAHPDNQNIVKYRLLRVEGRTQTFLAEVGADKLEYRHRRIDKEKSCTYALIAVDNQGRESLPAYLTIQPGSNLR
jgi:hypothetical protein